MKNLTEQELIKLVQAVFPPLEMDDELAVLVDLPNNTQEDNQPWADRRKIAVDWINNLKTCQSELRLSKVHLIAYPNVGSNNADLPEILYIVPDINILPETSAPLEAIGTKIELDTFLKQTQIILAPTEYSTTAPLKMAGKKYNFRAATMAGFSEKMLPALRLDYKKVGEKIDILAEKLDKAVTAKAVFVVDNENEYKINFDLRFRKSHPSSGKFSEYGKAGNLPSGETFIVPYEGEKTEEESLTEGILPVQFGEEVVYYTIEKNKAVKVTGEGEAQKREAELIKKEPAYSNIAELGFGVLDDFGIEPIGETLLDEKLGFHVAFGRSDHFGGMVGTKDFTSPQAVVHIDRIFISAIQPRVLVKSIILIYEDNKEETLISNGNYVIF